jgi:hypothetical protein
VDGSLEARRLLPEGTPTRPDEKTRARNEMQATAIRPPERDGLVEAKTHMSHLEISGAVKKNP